MEPHLDAHDAPEAPQAFKTHPELLAGMGGAEKARHEAKVAALAGESTASLCTRLETATAPAMLWPIHQELARRGIPPILRGPRHQHGLQGDFLDFAADLQCLWGSKTTIKPRYRLAQGIFSTTPNTPEWWGLVKRQFSQEGTRNTRGLSIAFNLDATQRRHLRTIQSADTRRLFDDLHGDHFGQLLDALRREAVAKPDKSKPRDQQEPHKTASRRARIYRTHQLMAGTLRDTARTWEALTGETLSAQAIRHQVGLVAPTFKQLRADWAKAQTE